MAANKFHLEILKAVVNYKKSSSALVRLFEKVAIRYYEEDRRDCGNASFFLNALKEFPVLQRAACDSWRTFGRFKLDIDKEGNVTLENNGKPKDDKPFKQAILAYIEKQYVSLLGAHQNKLMKAFDLDQRVKGFTNSATSIVVNAMAEEKGTQAEIVARLEAALVALRTADLSEKIQARKDELAEIKAAEGEAAETVAQPANEEVAEPAVNSENAA